MLEISPWDQRRGTGRRVIKESIAQIIYSFDFYSNTRNHQPYFISAAASC